MQLFSLIIWIAKFTDPIRDATDIRRISAIRIANSRPRRMELQKESKLIANRWPKETRGIFFRKTAYVIKKSNYIRIIFPLKIFFLLLFCLISHKVCLFVLERLSSWFKFSHHLDPWFITCHLPRTQQNLGDPFRYHTLPQ